MAISDGSVLLELHREEQALGAGGLGQTLPTDSRVEFTLGLLGLRLKMLRVEVGDLAQW